MLAYIFALLGLLCHGARVQVMFFDANQTLYAQEAFYIQEVQSPWPQTHLVLSSYPPAAFHAEDHWKRFSFGPLGTGDGSFLVWQHVLEDTPVLRDYREKKIAALAAPQFKFFYLLRGGIAGFFGGVMVLIFCKPLRDFFVREERRLGAKMMPNEAERAIWSQIAKKIAASSAPKGTKAPISAQKKEEKKWEAAYKKLLKRWEKTSQKIEEQEKKIARYEKSLSDQEAVQKKGALDAQAAEERAKKQMQQYRSLEKKYKQQLQQGKIWKKKANAAKNKNKQLTEKNEALADFRCAYEGLVAEQEKKQKKQKKLLLNQKKTTENYKRLKKKYDALLAEEEKNKKLLRNQKKLQEDYKRLKKKYDQSLSRLKKETPGGKTGGHIPPKNALTHLLELHKSDRQRIDEGHKRLTQQQQEKDALVNNNIFLQQQIQSLQQTLVEKNKKLTYMEQQAQLLPPLPPNGMLLPLPLGSRTLGAPLGSVGGPATNLHMPTCLGGAASPHNG